MTGFITTHYVQRTETDVKNTVKDKLKAKIRRRECLRCAHTSLDWRNCKFSVYDWLMARLKILVVDGRGS